MKITNFINPINPETERACASWFKLSLTLLAITVLYMLYIQVSLLLTWSVYRQEYKKYKNATQQYTQIIEEKKKLVEQEQILKNKLNKITNAHNQFCKQIEQLNILQKSCTPYIQLSSCSFTPGQVTIILASSTIGHAQAYYTTLNQGKHFADLKISSICPTKQVINITLKNMLQ